MTQGFATGNRWQDCWHPKSASTESLSFLQREPYFSPHQFCFSLPFQCWRYRMVPEVWCPASRGRPVGLHLPPGCLQVKHGVADGLGLRPWELSLHSSTQASSPCSSENCLALANEDTDPLIWCGRFCLKKCYHSHWLYFQCLFYLSPIWGMTVWILLQISGGQLRAGSGWKKYDFEDAPLPPILPQWCILGLLLVPHLCLSLLPANPPSQA